jgi:hypothetical protein
MKKVFSLMLLGLLVVSMIGTVSATNTLINGKIYNSDFSQTVSGATVSVDCNGNILPATSDANGAYAVVYNQTLCDSGDALTVSASHPSHGVGSLSGVITDNAFMGWDLAIVNVPLVPEFGIFIGALTILSAVGVFFLVRRE